MNKILLLFLLIGNAVFAQTADDIINKHFEATGGKEKWGKVTSLHYFGSYVIGPGMTAPLTIVAMNKPFKGFYQDFTWQGMTGKSVMQGDSGWTYQPFGGKRETDPMSANDIRSTKLQADPQDLLFNYKEKGYTVEYLGMDDMDGTDIYKLRLTTKEGDIIYYYIDAETKYILKEAVRMKLKDKEEKSYMTFSDFRKTDFGIIIPFSTQGVDEKGNEQGGPVNFTKVEVNTPIDIAIFDRTKAVKK